MEPVAVSAYAGYRAEERPRWVTWRGERREIAAVEQEWREPDGRAFLVRLEDGRRLRLRYLEREDRWEGEAG